MKRIFTIVAVTVLVWGCAKKITPAISSTAPSSNSGSVTPAPSKFEKPVVNTTPVPSTTAPVASVPSTTAPASRNPAEAKPSSPEMLGQATFNTKCGRCHGLKVTSDYTTDRWVSIMQVMAQKAQLSDVEKENVLSFVKANAKK